MTDEPDKAGKRKRKSARPAGQVIKRGEKKYLVRIFLGRDKETGARSWYNKTFHGTETDAKKWLTMALRRRDMGEPIEDTGRSLSSWLDEWLKMKAKTVRPRTLEIYTKNIERHVKPAIGNRKLSAVAAGDIQKLYSDLAGKKMSAKTISLIHAMLTGSFRQALRLELIRKSPMMAVDPPRIPKKEMRAMTAEQAQAFLKAADERPHGCWLALLLATGCRPGESQALKWGDLNLQAGTVTIQRNLVRLDKQWQFGEPKTASGRRTIPLSPGMVKRLSDHRRAQNEVRLKAGPKWKAHDLVFCNSTGEPYSVGYLEKEWKKALAAAGLPATFRSYDARHTTATLLLQDKLSPKVVSERLGHANVNITLNVYGHVLPGMQEEATERLEKLIFG
jgi:integrase